MNDFTEGFVARKFSNFTFLSVFLILIISIFMKKPKSVMTYIVVAAVAAAAYFLFVYKGKDGKPIISLKK